jgi:site-specific DNA-methyltransferase (adenine-specific)
MARKPLAERTVAANVLRWGTGAINVDRCRIAAPEGVNRMEYFETGSKSGYGGGLKGGASIGLQANGRWPANVIHDGSEEVTAAFPETTSGTFNGNRNADKFRSTYGDFKGTPERETPFEGSTGSAARFFYSAKADADDRLGSWHPTVKPVDLMQYLVRLVTPRAGVVLDPFAGTGTTGEAAWREGMRAVLVEAEPDYQADIRRRMALALAGPDERVRESIKARGTPIDYGPLFAALREAAE